MLVSTNTVPYLTRGSLNNSKISATHICVCVSIHAMAQSQQHTSMCVSLVLKHLHDEATSDTHKHARKHILTHMHKHTHTHRDTCTQAHTPLCIKHMSICTTATPQTYVNCTSSANAHTHTITHTHLCELREQYKHTHLCELREQCNCTHSHTHTRTHTHTHSHTPV